MNDKVKSSHGHYTLEDQDFLKSIGISAMTPGEEYAHRQYQEVLDARQRIEKRAAGLELLELDEKARDTISRVRDQPPSELRKQLRRFRDVEPDADENTFEV